MELGKEKSTKDKASESEWVEAEDEDDSEDDDEDGNSDKTTDDDVDDVEVHQIFLIQQKIVVLFL